MAQCELVLLTLLLFISQATAVTACDCTGGIVGAVLGTFFGTLIIVFVILVILWFCCLRDRLTKGRTPNVTYDASSSPPSNGALHVTDHSHPNVSWGIPTALRKFLTKCSASPESVHQIKLEPNPTGRDLGFSIAGRGVGLFLKDINNQSSLGHIRQFHEGSHVVGLSVAFDSWPVEVAADFITRAAPYRPQLHVRCKPIFDIDNLTGVPVLSSPVEQKVSHVPDLPPALVQEVSFEAEEIILQEDAKPVQAAPPLRMSDSRSTSPEYESIELSEENPAQLAASGLWTYDRSHEYQPERIVIVRTSMPTAHSSSDCQSIRTTSPVSLRSSASDAMDSWKQRGDIYRATPVHLPPEEVINHELKTELRGLEMDVTDHRMDSSLEPSYCRQPSSLDSGFGASANIVVNGNASGGGGFSSSDASQDGRPPLEASFALQGEPRLPPSLSGSSSPYSIIEEAIEQSLSPRSEKPPSGSRTGLEQLPELSALDRKIALNNIEIATLMLNDSHERLALADVPFSESEPESAHEEQIQPMPREEVYGKRRFIVGSEEGSINFGFTSLDEKGEDVELQKDKTETVVLQSSAKPSDDAEYLKLHARVNSGYESDETFA